MAIEALKVQARQILWKTSQDLYHKAVQPRRGQTFSIGVYHGRSPLGLRAGAEVKNPVITAADVLDVPASFVADPFLLSHGGHWYMFFEVLNSVYRRGQIGMARSTDGLNWQYSHIVLNEPFHLAYPHVFRWQNDIYMVPDSPGQGIRLYRARNFPGDWRLEKVLISDNYFCDSSLFQYQDRWWMLTGWVEKKGEPMSLRLFHADEPLGPWREHPASPVVTRDNSSARPAGRVQIINGHPYRFAQDCSSAYGESVHAYRIDCLTPTEYEETEHLGNPILDGGDRWWNQGGSHHIDACPADNRHWIACVDGWYTA